MLNIFHSKVHSFYILNSWFVPISLICIRIITAYRIHVFHPDSSENEETKYIFCTFTFLAHWNIPIPTILLFIRFSDILIHFSQSVSYLLFHFPLHLTHMFLGLPVAYFIFLCTIVLLLHCCVFNFLHELSHHHLFTLGLSTDGTKVLKLSSL